MAMICQTSSRRTSGKASQLISIAFALVVLSTLKCYSLRDLKEAICLATARQAGFDTGYYNPKNGKCVRGDEMSIEELMDPTIHILDSPIQRSL